MTGYCPDCGNTLCLCPVDVGGKVCAGDTVEYAQGRYVVAERHGDLLTLAGVAGNVVVDSDGDGRGTARTPTVVLASDVRRVEDGTH